MKPADFFIGLFLAAWCGAMPAHAEPPATVSNEQPTEVAASMEFLEFLGEFETEDGEWIDPDELEQMEGIDDQPESKKDEETQDD